MVERKMGTVQSHFLDSGAFTLWTRAVKYAKDNGTKRWAFYDTAEFWKYMDDYAAFVKKYKAGIDLYANVDVIPNPDLTWRNQKYLEDTHGLTPVPVVHYKTSLDWLNRYIDKGHELIGLGGLVGSTVRKGCRIWIDKCFDLVCDNSRRLPMVKLHGFGVTSFRLLKEYPWWSVDSVSWAKVGGFGSILLPRKKDGSFSFEHPSRVVRVSNESRKVDDDSQDGFFDSVVVGKLQDHHSDVVEWLDLIGIPFGKVGNDGEVIEDGVTTRHTERRAACLHYFERLRKSLPEWPWPFDSKRQPDFGFV